MAAPAAIGAQPAALQMHQQQANNAQVLNHPSVVKDKAQVETLTAPGYYSKAKRIKEFFNDNPEAFVRFTTHSVGTGVLISVLGGGIAAIASGGNPAVAYKGAAFGFAIGLAGGVLNEYGVIKHSRLYEVWSETTVPAKLYGIYGKYMDTDVAEFECPITSAIIKVPYADPEGHVFEAESILHYINTKGGRAMCPFRCGELTPASLHFDLTYHPRLLTAVTAAKAQFTAATNNPQIVQQAIQNADNLRRNVIAQRKEMVTQELDILIDDGIDCKKSSDEVASKVKNILDKYKLKVS